MYPPQGKTGFPEGPHLIGRSPKALSVLQSNKTPLIWRKPNTPDL
jgi:hypothetical protein